MHNSADRINPGRRECKGGRPQLIIRIVLEAIMAGIGRSYVSLIRDKKLSDWSNIRNASILSYQLTVFLDLWNTIVMKPLDRHEII